MNIIRTSENTVLILFEQVINSANFLLINQQTQSIKRQMTEYIIDIIPSYASIHITFNIVQISGLDFTQKLNEVLQNPHISNEPNTNQTVIEIPAYYGEEVALDLPHVAEKVQLSDSDVVRIHSETIYDVYAIGFAPGFAYLGNVDKRIAVSRKETPRQKVARGSIAIADQQTAIYPSESPGGWQVIGRTPIHLIDYSSKTLTQFTTGNKVKFVAISKSEFIKMGGTFE